MWWRKESWPQNLYLKLDVGRFFYRAQRSGSRSFLKLETSDFKIAKRKLAAKMADVSAVREQGASAANANFRLLVNKTAQDSITRVILRARALAPEAARSRARRLLSCRAATIIDWRPEGTDITKSLWRGRRLAEAGGSAQFAPPGSDSAIAPLGVQISDRNVLVTSFQ